MREIKFRAWDLDTSKWMQSWFNVRFDDGQVQLNQGGIQMNNYALMQYTGLKDKNGNEIYEGDIVQSAPTPHLTVPYLVWEVKWASDYFSDPWAEFILLEAPHHEHRPETSFRRLNDSVLKPIEVIGNIYETPELLEKS